MTRYDTIKAELMAARTQDDLNATFEHAWPEIVRMGDPHKQQLIDLRDQRDGVLLAMSFGQGAG